MNCAKVPLKKWTVFLKNRKLVQTIKLLQFFKDLHCFCMLLEVFHSSLLLKLPLSPILHYIQTPIFDHYNLQKCPLMDCVHYSEMILINNL